MRFHSHHGKNLILTDDRRRARRRCGFGNGILFGDRPLRPLEVFSLEICQIENAWVGNVRIGLTILNPNERISLPNYALPQLNSKNLAWVFEINRNKKYHVIEDHEILTSRNQDALSLLSLMINDETNRGRENRVENDFYVAAKHRTELGCKIGLYYRLSIENDDKLRAEMHFTLNGVDQGPVDAHIPFINGRPLYVMVDVYGRTKDVRISNDLQNVTSLQDLCRNCLLENTPCEKLDFLPLPRFLKLFLRK